MRKALITGGAGFIGYHLAKNLLRNGYTVTLIDNFSRGVYDDALIALEKSEEITFINKNLLEEGCMDDIECDYEYIFHLAAIIGVQNVLEHSYDVLEKNVLLLIRLIHFAEKQKNLKRFLFASTSEIYAGTLQYYDMQIPTPEDTPLTITDLDQSRTSYMLSKIYGEALLRQTKLPYTIIRPHNFYGPRMGMSHVIPQLLDKAVKLNDEEALEVYSVEHTRTFCYIDDAVEMIRLLAESDQAIRNFYNIGNQTPEVTMQYVGECVLSVTNRKSKITALPPTEGSPSRRCPDVQKLYNTISYVCRTDLNDGIEQTYQWYRDNIFSGKSESAK